MKHYSRQDLLEMVVYLVSPIQEFNVDDQDMIFNLRVLKSVENFP